MFYPADRGSIYEALSWVLGNRGTQALISGNGTRSTNEGTGGTKATLGEQGTSEMKLLMGTKRFISGEQVAPPLGGPHACFDN